MRLEKNINDYLVNLTSDQLIKDFEEMYGKNSLRDIEKIEYVENVDFAIKDLKGFNFLPKDEIKEVLILNLSNKKKSIGVWFMVTVIVSCYFILNKFDRRNRKSYEESHLNQKYYGHKANMTTENANTPAEIA